MANTEKRELENLSETVEKVREIKDEYPDATHAVVFPDNDLHFEESLEDASDTAEEGRNLRKYLSGGVEYEAAVISL